MKLALYIIAYIEKDRANFIKPLDTWFKVEPGHNLKIDQVSKLDQFH